MAGRQHCLKHCWCTHDLEAYCKSSESLATPYISIISQIRNAMKIRILGAISSLPFCGIQESMMKMTQALTLTQTQTHPELKLNLIKAGGKIGARFLFYQNQCNILGGNIHSCQICMEILCCLLVYSSAVKSAGMFQVRENSYVTNTDKLLGAALQSRLKTALALCILSSRQTKDRTCWGN